MGRIVGLLIDVPAKPQAANEAPAFVCPECGKTYKSKEALDKHIEAKHKGEGATDPTASGE